MYVESCTVTLNTTIQCNKRGEANAVSFSKKLPYIPSCVRITHNQLLYVYIELGPKCIAKMWLAAAAKQLLIGRNMYGTG